MSTDIALLSKHKDIAQKLNGRVLDVMGADQLKGFEKAYLVANATSELKLMLSDEYMKPIMELQGSKLGFKTDKDDKGGYSLAIVKNCLIEAVLTGVQPYGNQFNIIAGNMYITKEGFGYLLKNLHGLTAWEIIPSLPRIKEDKTSAAVVMKIKWTVNGKQEERDLDIPVKMNSFMGSDAVLGKGTRKARAWLYNTITGSEISDGDTMDAESSVVSSTINKVEQSEEHKEKLKEMAQKKEGAAATLFQDPKA